MTDTWLVFTAENRHEIPGSLRDHTYIERLILCDCELEQLPDDLAGCSELFSINLADNQLKTIPEGIFTNENMPRLCSVDLENNQLTELPADLLQLNALEYLTLSHNPIQQLGTRIHLPKLHDWFVEEIAATELPEDIYLPEIESFEWRGAMENRTLPEGFAQSQALKEIRIYDSLLHDVSALSQLPHLQTVILMNAQLQTLPELPATVQRLDLLNNPLTEIPAHIGKLKNVKNLQLNGHRLRAVPAEMSELTALEALEMVGEPMQQFPVDFTEWKKLRYLRLRLAPQTILSDSFVQLPSLHFLELTGGVIAPEAVWRLPKLAKIQLKQGSIAASAFADGQAFPELTYLEISHWQTDALLDVSNLSNLTTLYLSHTTLRLGDLPDNLEDFYYLHSLTAGAAFLQLPANLYQLPHLKKIAIHQNLLAPADWEALKQHCEGKGIQLEGYVR